MKRSHLITGQLLVLGLLVIAPRSDAWNNGPQGNTATTTAQQCSNPPYATHDWIADHALELLPQK